MPIQTLHRLAELDPTEWDALLADSQPFLCHAFLSALEDSGSVGGRSGWQPAHRLLRDPQGGLRAALPLYRKSHSYGEYVFDWAWADACPSCCAPYRSLRSRASACSAMSRRRQRCSMGSPSNWTLSRYPASM